ncbi:MAG: LapA family protein [Woeseiaceae bacterium]|jgi:putative membrane protein
MLRRAGLIVLVVLLVVIMFTFTALNTGRVDLDLAFVKGSYPVSLSFAITFVAGIVFGMLCMTSMMLRLLNDRRTLRRQLRLTESEIKSLRNLPLSDAD